MPNKIVSITPANDFIVMHPALDYVDGKSIIAVSSKWIVTRESGSSDLMVKPFCIMYDKKNDVLEKFIYSKDEIIKHNLFHVGYIDAQENLRWGFDDIEKFTQEQKSLAFSELYNLVYNKIEYYMDFDYDKSICSLLTCFIIYTYFYPIFNFAPIIQMWGEFKSGKTKICSLLEALIFNPINSANISSASVFRLIESRRAVIILDESEDLLGSEKSRDIRNMLLAGTGKSGETFRQEKTEDDTYSTRAYKVFSPKIIANIAGIDVAALQSRVIQVNTVTSNNKEKLNRDINLDNKVEWETVRNELYRSSLMRSCEVDTMRTKLAQHELTGRTFRIWEGILTIASLVGEETWNEMIAFAKRNKESMENEMADFGNDPNELPSKLLSLCIDGKPCKITPTDLLIKLNELGISITSAKDLAFKMGKYGLKSKIGRNGSSFERFYILTKDKIERYIRVIDLSKIEELNVDGSLNEEKNS